MSDLNNASPQGSNSNAINDGYKIDAHDKPGTKTGSRSHNGGQKYHQRYKSQEVNSQNSSRQSVGNHRENKPLVGFDNSDKNKERRSLGSCTDKVAVERRAFGPWLEPNAERQRSVVERLAPPKPVTPQDPRFDHWVNHFEYFCTIGVDVKKPRSRTTSARQSSPGTPRNSSPNNGLYQTRYHRLLKRPRTTSARLPSVDSEGEHNMSGSSSGSGSGTMTRRKVTSRETYRGSSGGSSGYESGRVVSGLDRRYMGLQSVSKDQMQDIVSRLTRMTSAYNAKFAPNPHVWIDTAPGAHMVKRENTIA